MKDFSFSIGMTEEGKKHNRDCGYTKTLEIAFKDDEELRTFGQFLCMPDFMNSYQKYKSEK